MQFLWENKATVNFRKKELTFHEQYVPLSGLHTIHLPDRTKKLINIPVIDPLIKNGYIRRIEAGPGVFLGESLVSHDGFVKTYAINSNAHDIDLTLGPVELEPFHTIQPRSRGASTPSSPTEATKVAVKRLPRLLENLNLADLNAEEKGSLLPILSDYSAHFTYLETR